MLRIALFVILLVAAAVYALRKGGGPERAMAMILLAMAASDQILHLFIPARFLQVDTGHLLIDVLAAAATLILALKAYRFWPLIAGSLQLLPLVAHSTRAIDIALDPIAYLTMQVAASWLLPPLLALGTYRHQRRIRQTGSEPSWVGSSTAAAPTAIA